MANDSHVDEQDWQEHIVRAGMHRPCLVDKLEPDEHRKHVEPKLPALNQRARIRNVSTLLPPSDEQREIATVLSDMDAEITTLEQRRDKTRTLKQGMIQQILTRRVRLVNPDRDRETTRC